MKFMPQIKFIYILVLAVVKVPEEGRVVQLFLEHRVRTQISDHLWEFSLRNGKFTQIPGSYSRWWLSL